MRLCLEDVSQDLPLCGHIQRAGGLVQQQHRRIGQQCPGNGQPLHLAGGQAAAPLLQLGVQALGQLPDKLPSS